MAAQTTPYPRAMLGAVLAEANARTVPLQLSALAVWRRIKSVVMTLLGFACFTAAAFTWHVWAGLLVAGVSFIVLDLAHDWERQKRDRP